MASALFKEKKKAIGYTRVSKDPNHERLSASAQEDTILDYTDHKRWSLIDIVQDIDVPGSNFDRPGWEEVKQRFGEFDVVVITELTRFGRNLGGAIRELEGLQEAGIDLVSVREEIDTTSAAGKLFWNMIMAISQFEHDRLGERIGEGKQKAKREGHWAGGPPSLGYDYINGKIVVNEEEAKLVKRIFTDYVVGYNKTEIARRLNEEGKKGKKGGKFYPSSIDKILNNKEYLGGVVEIPQIIKDRLWHLTRQNHGVK